MKIKRADGFLETEVENMKKVADLCAEATGWSKEAAFLELSTPGTRANRLMNFGGRFLDSAENFKQGMRLLGTFEKWFTGMGQKVDAMGNDKTRTKDMDKTMLNVDTSQGFKPNILRGMEKFVFESIANDSSFNLAETDANRLFGIENNAVTHFFVRNLNHACTQTIAQIPLEKRSTFYTAVNMFFPIIENAEDANKKGVDRGESKDTKIVVGRVLKNLEAIIELEKKGELTFENVARLIVPELPADSKFEFRKVGNVLTEVMNGVEGLLQKKVEDWSGLLGVALDTIQQTGCSAEEAVESVTGGKKLPLPPYVSSGTLDLEIFDGTTKVGRKLLETDLPRADGYSDVDKKSLLPQDKNVFTFNFPEEGPITTNATPQGRKNVNTVIEKIEALCGKARTAQTLSVMTMVSQSGTMVLRGSLSVYGINSTEHAPCDFTLSKDDKTGVVTIRYSSPKELPFTFGWTATVGPDGKVESTPLEFKRKSIDDLAVEVGYHESELQMVKKAFEFIKSATGCSDYLAITKALDPLSPERRLFGYGGRFTDSVDNFKKGLALMGKFEGWYDKIAAEVEKNKGKDKNDLAGVSNATVRNANAFYLERNTVRAYEKFLFEELAANDKMPLDAEDPEKVFGMEANAAMRFVGRGFTSSINDSVARMPVEVRQILFAAFDAMLPLAKDANGLRENSFTAGAVMPVARVMRHLEELRGLQKNGEFTAENVKKLLFPEVQNAGTKSLKAIVAEIETLCETESDILAHQRISVMMRNSGYTYQEVVDADRKGSVLPSAPHIISGTGALSALDGTANGARKQAVGDLIRPSNPESTKTHQAMLKRECCVFTVRFPGGAVLTSGASDKHAENEGPANKIANEVEKLVGDRHPAQLSAVMMGLTQSAHGPFRSNAVRLGFVNNTGAEHSALTYTLSRNEETGAITIRYSEPEGFPTKFHWETTIALDGSSVTTPLVIDK